MKVAKDKFTLGLELPTDPRWTGIAQQNIKDILIDHAYCEQKAASSCISLIVQHPEREKLVETLAPLVKEEWGHFERVLAELKKRGDALGPQRKDEYVEELTKFIIKGGSREQHLVEKLLLNALIEARSCERFKILWKTIPDPELCRILSRADDIRSRSLQDFSTFSERIPPRRGSDETMGGMARA